jgi:CDP-diglyceride synthetase
MGLLMFFVINAPFAFVNNLISNGLNSLNDVSIVLLGTVLAAMMSIDMGGPINKAAYVFGTAAITSGNYAIMAPVMIGGMVPPLVIALATTLFPHKFTKKERTDGKVNYIMGLSFITEGAIPFAASDPWRVILSCSVFDKRYTIVDSIYAFTTMLYLSLGLKGMLYLRSVGGVENINHGIMVIVFVLLVTCLTDIFAYFGGMTCYKILGADKVHKLNERISPKKTIEGTIVGTLFGTGLGFLFAILALKNVDLGITHWSLYLLMSFVLSIFGQIGDLVLSAVKRHFGIKDYSNLLPGHGGVLDRIDSLLLNSMMAAIFLVTMSYIL